MSSSLTGSENLDQRKWNADWEQKLALEYFPGVEMQGSLYDTMSPERRDILSKLQVHTRLYSRIQSKEICILQQDLSELATEKFVLDNLQQKWQDLTQNRREELVLEGIWGAAHFGPDLERFREWCPEITVENLAGFGDNGFLQLTQKLMPDDLEAELMEPIMVAHPIIDRLLGPAEDASSPNIKKIVQAERCYFITVTLWKIFLALYGLKEDYIVAKPHDKPSLSYKVLRDIIGKKEIKEELKAFHQMREVHKNTPNEPVNACSYCHKDESRLEGLRLKACLKCKSIGKAFLYCSRECQASDWKNGSPVPHKRICGKVIIDEDDLLTNTKPVTNTYERIPAPDPSFKRSPALLHQIRFLKQPPYVDYVFTAPFPYDDQGFSCPTMSQRLKFLVLRRRALQTGDHRAVFVMFQIIVQFAFGPGITPVTFVKQLQDEYGIDIDSIDPEELEDLPPPTDQELELAYQDILNSQRQTATANPSMP